MLEFIQTNNEIIAWMAAGSLATFLLSIAAIPWVLLHLPHDYFASKKRTLVRKLEGYPVVLQWLWVVLKNFFGLFFLLAGLLLLLLPGQGLLTMLLGIALLNFPGKYWLERWLVTRGATLRLINRFREKHGREPLIVAPLDED